MCGINGIINLSDEPVYAHEIEQMNNEITHRGPDGFGVYTNGNIGLGHRRLSIIDVSHHSDQPFVAADENYIIVFNGEIYNYVEIRNHLITRGYRFRTESDTEVLLYAYVEFGEKCVSKLNGMFSFAVYNKINQEVFIARDRSGIKPLFYSLINNRFVFSSEIKSIKKIDRNSLVLNQAMIDVYMSSGYCFGSDTLYAHIKKIDPGCAVVIKNNKVKHFRYWDIDYSNKLDISITDHLNNIEDIVLDATKIHLRSDVPLGVFLSGGLDSSAIVALMDKKGIQNIKTFSVNWDLGEKYNESVYARQVSSLFKTQHFEYVMNETEFIQTIDKYIYFMDEPVTEAAAISLYKLSELTSKHVKVVLSGEGADEVFGGYPIYKLYKYIDLYKHLPVTLRRKIIDPILGVMDSRLAKLVKLSQQNIRDVYSGVSFGDYSDVTTLYTAEYKHESYYKSILNEFYDRSESYETQVKMQYIDYKTWLADDLLIKADRMTMAHSLELRVPLLDYRLIDYMATVPSALRLKNNHTKFLFKKLMERYLPKKIIYRKKMGFPTPLKLMFSNDLGHLAKEMVLDGELVKRRIFKKDIIEKLFKEEFNGVADNHKLLWKIFVLEKWMDANR